MKSKDSSTLLNARNLAGETPLTIALATKNTAAADLLRAAGAKDETPPAPAPGVIFLVLR